MATKVTPLRYERTAPVRARTRRRRDGRAALHHLRLGRRRQVDADRPAAVRHQAAVRRPARDAEERQRQARHAGREFRLRAAARRPRGRARAGHHDRRRLSLLLDRQAQVHRRGYAGARAVHAQHGDGRLDGRSRHHPDRCAPGRAAADQAAHLHRQHAGRETPRAGHQQDGPGRLQPRALPRDRGELSGDCGQSRFRVDHADPDVGAEWRQRHQEVRCHVVASRADAAGASRDDRDRGRARRCAVPPAGAVGEPSEPRFPRLLGHGHLRLGEAG